jgi:ribosome-binding factor A
MPKSYRIERINGVIKEIISELVQGGIKDPRVGLVTITAVRVSNDMAVAKVYYSVMGDESERQATHKGLVSARNFIRGTIGHELKLKNAPELRFVYDDSLERSITIEQKLREEEEKRKGAPNSAEGEGVEDSDDGR